MAGQHGVGGAQAVRARLQRLARAGEWASLGGIVMVAGWFAYALFDVDAMRSVVPRVESAGAVAQPGGTALLLAWLVAAVPAGLFISAMWMLRSLFRRLAAGELFHPRIQWLLRSLGWLAIAVAAAGMVAQTLATLILTWNNPPGQRQLVLAISSGDFSAVLVGFLLLAFAIVMGEAIRLEEENRSIV